MSYTADELREVALLKKNDLKNKFFNIVADDFEYKFKISGVGKSTIKIEKFFYYSELCKAISEEEDDSFEWEIVDVIMDGEVTSSFSKLSRKALSDKNILKNKYVNFIIGYEDYDFRIAGIGTKSVKIELYHSYEDIVENFDADEEDSLEFILTKLILGEVFKPSEFKEVSKSKPSEDPENETFKKEIDINTLKKLSDDELEDILFNVKGWQKLVFDTIEDIIDDTFSFEDLISEKRLLSYKSSGEDFEEKVLVNLNQLEELGLICEFKNKNYFKLWE